MPGRGSAGGGGGGGRTYAWVQAKPGRGGGTGAAPDRGGPRGRGGDRAAHGSCPDRKQAPQGPTQCDLDQRQEQQQGAAWELNVRACQEENDRDGQGEERSLPGVHAPKEQAGQNEQIPRDYDE